MTMVLKWKNGMLRFDEQLLHHIRQKHNGEVRSILTNDDSCKLTDSTGATLLHFASEYDNANIAQYLIDSGVNVNGQDEFGRTALLLAVRLSQAEISSETISVLLEANADIFKADINGKYPLQCVVDSKAFDNLGVVRKFYQRLARHCQNDDKSIADLLIKAECPLERAVYFRNCSVTERLIKAGRDVDELHPRFGHTALHVAATTMDLQNIKVLIEYGANVMAKVGHRLLPLSLYFLAGKYRNHPQNPEVMKLLMDECFRAADRAEDIALSVKHVLLLGDEQTVRRMLQYDVDFSVRGNNGNSALHYLAMNDNSNVAKTFEGKIANVNVRNLRGCTPLHYAVVARNSITMQLFLDNGAHVNDKSHIGNTPLSALFFTLSENHSSREQEIVEILLQRDADIQVVLPDSQDTIFDFVVRSKRFDLGEPLVAKLAFLEQLGEPIIDLIRSKVDAHETLKNYYDLCRRQLEEMKNIVIYESITLFKLLRQSERQIVRRYAYSQGLIEELQSFSAKYFLSSYYYEILEARIRSALPKIKLIQNVARVIFNLVGPQFKGNYLVVCKIIDCLSYEDMKVLNTIKMD